MWAAGLVLYMMLIGDHPFEEGKEVTANFTDSPFSKAEKLPSNVLNMTEK